MDSAEDTDSSNSEMNTDDEFQHAIETGNLYAYKKGLIQPLVSSKKNCTNDVLSLRQRRTELYEKNPQWLERMDVTTSVKTVERTAKKLKSTEHDNTEDDVIEPDNDFKREMHFFCQAQAAVAIGLEKLEELDIPSLRPLDYFAEMVKTDDHMRKVREKLLSKQKRMESIEKAKKLRELRKYGKKVQQNVLEQRRQEKKRVLDSVRKFTKGRGEKPEFLRRKDDDDYPPNVMSKKNDRRSQGPPGLFSKSKRRQMKDQKYGSKNRGIKKNTAESSADISSYFNPQRMGGRGNSRKGQGRNAGRGNGPKSRGGGRGQSGSGKNKLSKRTGKGSRQKIKQRKRN